MTLTNQLAAAIDRAHAAKDDKMIRVLDMLREPARKLEEENMAMKQVINRIQRWLNPEIANEYTPLDTIWIAPGETLSDAVQIAGKPSSPVSIPLRHQKLSARDVLGQADGAERAGELTFSASHIGTGEYPAKGAADFDRAEAQRATPR